MKGIVDYILLLLYSVCMYIIWKLCQFGGLRYWMKILIPFVVLLIIFLLVKLVLRHKGYRGDYFKTRLSIFLAVTLFFGGLIVYTAMPYHGALSWKLEELLNRKKVTFTHNNIYEYGIDGVLSDMDDKFSLPEELYISDVFSIKFTEDGTITNLETMLYGHDGEGKIKSFLVSYNSQNGNKLYVWINKNVHTSLESDKALSPLSTILNQSDYKEQVKYWSTLDKDQTYGILFYGRQTFNTDTGLRFVEGDVDGDGINGSSGPIYKLSDGGAVIGYEASLYLPDDETVTPIRYIMEPEYISQETLDVEHENQIIEDVKEAKGWTVDENNGTVYTFVLDNSTIGYRLIIMDAAAGSRFYAMEKTTDGGDTWKMVNKNPFMGEIGAAEGIEFFSEDFGFIGIQGASGQHSQIYVTRDGGANFSEIKLPMDQVRDVPEQGKAYGLTIEDYDYISMPEYEGESLVVSLTPNAEESAGIKFYSEDAGQIWKLLK